KDTTGDALAQFFRTDFQDIVNGNVTLLFVLSHGEFYKFPNTRYGNDLYIVTTDTDSKNIRKKGLSLTTDLVLKLSGLKDGSILLAFIDTCHAGAAKNFGLDLSQVS